MAEPERLCLRCPACGARYEGEARFCTRDGSRLLPVDGGGREVGAAPASASPSVASIVGALVGGRYRVRRRVGEGGMAVVYQADDEAAGERCALKVLLPLLAGDETAMARLRREAELGRLLRHRNVCPILAMGQVPGGPPYVVMPFLEGETLSDLLQRAGPLPAARVAALVRDVAEGLHAAHALGIVHRDLKPENVMVCADDRGGERAVVMDFGLATSRRARMAARRLTRTGMVMGTPEFMSPEQLMDQPLDARSDVYALALVACELLTGQLPFVGDTQQDQMLARLRSTPLPLRSLHAELVLPEEAERVVRRGLATAREERYPTAPAFAAAFAAAVHGGATEPGRWGER